MSSLSLADTLVLVERMSEGVAIFDLEGRFLYINPAGEELARQPAAELVGRLLSDVFRAFPGNPVEEAIRVLARGEQTRIVLDAFYEPDRDAWYEVELFREGDRIYALGREVTELHEKVERLLVAKEEMETVMGILGHDLRGPLAAVALVAESLLRRVPTESNDARALRQIRAASQRMQRLIGELLDVSAERRGSAIPLAPREMSLVEVCRAVMAETQLLQPGAELRLEADGDIRGFWDEARLAEVVQNLISNALDHGDADRPVTIQVRAHAGTALLSVHNFGAPIDEARLASLYEPFSRAGGHHLGLGLFICRRIVTAHGGRIEVATSAADGTTFAVHLPISKQYSAIG